MITSLKSETTCISPHRHLIGGLFVDNSDARITAMLCAAKERTI